MGLHKSLIESENHIPFGLGPYADNIARVSATVTSSDIGKIAWQQDDNTVWLLVDNSPLTWKQITPDAVASSTNHVDTVCIKNSPGTINKGQAVYIVGYDDANQAIKVELACANSTTTMPSVGIAVENFTNLVTGSIRLQGKLEGVDTSLFAVNNFLHISPTVSGLLTSTHPSGPDVHQVVAKVAKVDAVDGVLAINVPAEYDHLSNSTPNAIGTASAGTSAFSSRRDHIHAHGNQSSDGNMHAVVIAGGAAGFMSGSDKTKLDGIVTGAELSKLRQSKTELLAVDASINNAVFTDLLSTTITTASDAILIVSGWYSAFGNAQGRLRIDIDGTPYNTVSNHGHAGTIYFSNNTFVRVSGLASGSHTVKIQWASTATITCNASTSPTTVSAGILILETTA